MAKVHDHNFWRCGRPANISMLHRRNLALKASRWKPWDTFQIRKRSSNHPGHSFNMMVRLHLNCQKDLLCHQLCLQRTSLENELKYSMPAKPNGSPVFQSKVMMTAHLKAFRTQIITVTGMATCIIQMTAKMIVRQMLNLILSQTMPMRIPKEQGSGKWGPHRTLQDWFGQQGGQDGRLEVIVDSQCNGNKEESGF